MRVGKVIQQADDGYPPVYVWSNGPDGAWACVAPEHGPMCRRCQPMEGVLAALVENVELGLLTARASPSGEFQFKMTAKGDAAAEDLVQGDVRMAALWAKVQEGGPDA